MATTQQITIVTGLPKFAGVPRAGEAHFLSEVTAKYFLEVLENHFSSHGIHDEQDKINLFYNMIDHTKGNAMTLIPCFKGSKIKTFEEIKQQMLDFYDKDEQSEFRPAAKSFMKINLLDDIEGNLTNLNILSQNLAQAYVTGEHFLGVDFDADTIIANKSEGTDDYDVGSEEPLKLVDVLQNFIMQIGIHATTHKKVAEKVKKVGPRMNPSKLMTYTVKVIHEHPLPNADKIINKRDEVVWKASEPTQSTTQLGTKIQHNRTNKPTYNTKTQYRGDDRQKCFNCNEVGHTRRECRVCAFCKKPGHNARFCEARIKKARGKFCTNCQLKDSHDTHECYTNGRRTNKTGHRNVRMLREYPYDDGPSYNNEWAPNDCEYRDDQQGEHPTQT